MRPPKGRSCADLTTLPEHIKTFLDTGVRKPGHPRKAAPTPATRRTMFVIGVARDEVAEAAAAAHAPITVARSLVDRAATASGEAAR